MENCFRRIIKKIVPREIRDILGGRAYSFLMNLPKQLVAQKNEKKWEIAKEEYNIHDNKEYYYKNCAIRIKTYGKENPKRRFYLLCPWFEVEGLFSLVATYLRGIRDCVELDFIPIVDMKNYKTAYITDELLNKENAWEYYFEQPLGYRLEDVEQSKNVYKIKPFETFDEYTTLNQPKYYYNDKGIRTYWRNLAKKYIRIKPEILNDAKKLSQTFFSGAKRVLGVIARGTDYKVRLASRLYIPPTTEQLFAKIDELRHSSANLHATMRDGGGVFTYLFNDRRCRNLRAI